MCIVIVNIYVVSEAWTPKQGFYVNLHARPGNYIHCIVFSYYIHGFICFVNFVHCCVSQESILTLILGSLMQPENYCKALANELIDKIL